MKVELFPFQKKALVSLRSQTAEALGSYRRTSSPQVISFTAPTGAGKTIIVASLIEEILYGGIYPEQPEAIFVWLSDSPELNEQSKLKIETKSDRIGLHQCVTIDDASFDREVLEDGHIYFLNTQKLSKSSRLTSHSDGRNYTIWETLQNTAEEKSDRLYFVIDEAHRGMQGRDASKATTIMQKFLKGSGQDNMDAMPIVIGMSATTERFNNLISNIPSTVHKTIVTAEEVRESGLLKDRIIITYPDEETGNKDMAVLQAAADDWRNKWDHWLQYCREQHHAMVNPIFVVQVLNGTKDIITHTDLDDCLMKIEQRTGFHFEKGEVVHCFGEQTKLTFNGLEVLYEEPSRIADDKNIKVVFFKESLSTGWDCPRAETMMSFRPANDATYIAQLLGRMVRTPIQMRIQVDDSLNDVHLYLPHFNSSTVKAVVDELQKSEGGDIPADVYGESIGDAASKVLTIRPKKAAPTSPVNTDVAYKHGNDYSGTAHETSSDSKTPSEEPRKFTSNDYDIPQHEEARKEEMAAQGPTNEGANAPDLPVIERGYIEAEPEEKVLFDDGIDREAIIKFINEEAFLTYDIRHVKIAQSDISSLFALVRLLTQSGLNFEILDDVKDEIVEMIHSYVDELKEKGRYEKLAEDVMEFKLLVQIFDVFGETVDNYKEHNLISATDTDIDRQLRLAEAKLGGEGIAYRYGQKHKEEDDDISYKIDVILFAADDSCMVKLNAYAKDKFNKLNDDYRRKIVKLNDRGQKQYNDLVSDSAEVTEHNFKLPEAITPDNGKEYEKHLFVDPETGLYKTKLNTWEEGVLMEEMKREDFVCWLRNPSRKYWSLTIPYNYNGKTTPAYPDLIIVRKDPDTEYVIDILEPHLPKLDDNLPKAKGFAEYAKKNQSIGRIELIREGELGGQKRFVRLDLSKTAIREKVLQATTPEELNKIFDIDGEFN